MRVLHRLDSLDPRLPVAWVHKVAEDDYKVSRPGWTSRSYTSAEIEAYVQTSYSQHDTRTSPDLDIGEYRPRIWRGENNPPPDVHFPREWASCFGGLVNLTRRMQELFRYVEPVEENRKAYGHESRQLLILAATEAESSWKAVLLANNYPGKGNWATKDYVKLLEPMLLYQWRLSLHGYPGFPPVAPFASWRADPPTQSLLWYAAYNDVKHDRERAFAKATLEHAVEAVAAAYVMFVAQFGEPDQRNADGLGDFRVQERSVFPREQRYVPPSIAGEQEPWTAVPLPLAAS